MEFFPDGAFVRLQSRVRRRYLHADEDGRGVSLSPVRASLNSAWRVHRVVRNDVPFVLLYGAAYGRYLTASNEPAPFGHREKLVVQGVYDHPAVSAVLWTAVEAEQGGGYVLLRHISDRPLRANGRHLSWNNGVTVDHPDSQSTMTHWVVEAIPLLPGAPSLQPQVHTVYTAGAAFLGLIARLTVAPVRTIRYVMADDDGNFSNYHGWVTFQYEGRSVTGLTTAVAQQLGHNFCHVARMCTRAGRYGRVTPMIISLPRSHDPIEVIALAMGTPAALALQYPDVDAP